MNRLAVYVSEQRVESAAADLTPVGHVEIAVICLDVRKSLIPFGLLNTPQFFTLNLGDDTRRFVRVFGCRGQLGQCRVHRLRQQFFTQARCVGRAIIVSHPL